MKPVNSDNNLESKIDEWTLAFVVRTQGNWTCEALSQYREILSSTGNEVGEQQLEETLGRARELFFENKAGFFLCDGAACRKRRLFDIAVLTDPKGEMQNTNCGVTLTECQGPCKFAPIATVRVGKRSAMFSEFPQESDLNRIVEFTTRAIKANTLLVDIGSARSYQFDPVHEGQSYSTKLKPIEFLIGHFMGEGRCEMKNYSFVKEVVGEWQVGGRFLALRMGATYNLKSGLKDMHQAFIVLGFNSETGNLESRAYTDAGFIRDFEMVVDDNRLIFADAIPHGTGATRARKVLVPSATGYDETLELDYGDGQYQPYYHVKLMSQSAVSN